MTGADAMSSQPGIIEPSRIVSQGRVWARTGEGARLIRRLDGGGPPEVSRGMLSRSPHPD